MTLSRFWIAALFLALAGCAAPRDSVVFVTKTSLGLDVEGTPPTASFAYDRTEGYFGPRFDNGSVPPVAGSFFTNGGLFDRKIRQVYATGDAAISVTTPGTTSTVAKPDVSKGVFSGDHKPMFFGTSTVVGVKVAFGSGGVADALTLGFKRKEASVIPITTATASVTALAGSTTTYGFPSVIASVETDTTAALQTTTTVGVLQYFATGEAADNVAKLPGLRNAFAQYAADAVAQYRDEERNQAAVLLDTLSCFSELPDAKIAQVWSNAEQLELFPSPDVYTGLRAKPPAEARAMYTRYVVEINARSQRHTGLLIGHKTYVCQLRG